MIQVNKITPQVIEHFGPYGNSLGMLNQYEHNDLRIQIKEQKAEGYYVFFNGVEYPIDKTGRWRRPTGAYTFLDDQLCKLIS